MSGSTGDVGYNVPNFGTTGVQRNIDWAHALLWKFCFLFHLWFMHRTTECDKWRWLADINPPDITPGSEPPIRGFWTSVYVRWVYVRQSWNLAFRLAMCDSVGFIRPCHWTGDSNLGGYIQGVTSGHRLMYCTPEFDKWDTNKNFAGSIVLCPYSQRGGAASQPRSQVPYDKIKARFPLPELASDRFAVSITRQHGPCWRARVSTSGVNIYCYFLFHCYQLMTCEANVWSTVYRKERPYKCVTNRTRVNYSFIVVIVANVSRSLKCEQMTFVKRIFVV